MNCVQKITFSAVPQSVEEFTTLPQAAMTTPFQTAALTVLALSVYAHNKDAGIQMLNYLRGPRSLSVMEIQFIRDRFMDKDYVPRSYFDGATAQNDYTPAQPLTISVGENPYSYHPCAPA